MLRRRHFLLYSTLLSFSSCLHAKNTLALEKKNKSAAKIIDSVLAHLFPENSKLPSAKSIHLSSFLFKTVMHPSYDKDLRNFVIEGAEELDRIEQGRFTLFSNEQKEKSLRSYEESNYGASWLSRIITLGTEGCFSDPIYGSNTNQTAWKAIKSFGGFPRPKTKYLL